MPNDLEIFLGFDIIIRKPKLHANELMHENSDYPCLEHGCAASHIVLYFPTNEYSYGVNNFIIQFSTQLFRKCQASDNYSKAFLKPCIHCDRVGKSQSLT